MDSIASSDRFGRVDSTARNRPRQILLPALAPALFAWSVLWSLPTALRSSVGPAASTGIAFALLCGLLLVTRVRGADRGGHHVVALLALGALAGFATLPLWLLAIVAVGSWIGIPPIAHVVPDSSPVHAWLQLVVLAPVFEELLYRERILRALRARLGPACAVLGSSAMFALPHWSAWGVLATLPVGVALGALMLCARSTALCIGYHAGLNVAMLLVAASPFRDSAPLKSSALFGFGVLLVGIRLARVSAPRRVVCAALVCVLLPQPGLADLLRWDGSLVFDPIEEAIPPLEIAGSGIAEVNRSGGGLALTSLRLQGGIDGSVIEYITDETLNAGALVAMKIDASLGSGTLRPFQPPAGPVAAQLSRGRLPLRGELRLCFILTSCEGSSDIGLTASTSGGSHFGVGLGGTAVRVPYGTNPVSVAGAPWTVRTTQIALPTPGGFSVEIASAGWVHGAWSFTGSTALTGGALQLVTPAVVTPFYGDSPATGFARLTIHFVPEPDALLLFGSGALGLVFAGWRRGAS